MSFHSTSQDPPGNPPLVAGSSYPFGAPVEVKVPPGARQVPTPFNDLRLTMSGQFDLRRHLGIPTNPALFEADSTGKKPNWERLIQSDVLFLSLAASDTGPVVAPANDWHPTQLNLYKEAAVLGPDGSKSARNAFMDKIWVNVVRSVRGRLAFLSRLFTYSPT
jgi:hypothetical protein